MEPSNPRPFALNLLSALAAAALVVAGCGSENKSASSPSNGGPPASTRGFISFASGSPASTFWSERDQALYVADNDNNQIWKWTDKSGLAALATTADPGGQVDASATLVGQIIELENGTLVVARFGKPGGGFAGIAWVRQDGSTGLVPDLDATFKRLGLTQAADGSIYGTYFAKGASGKQTGSVTRVDLDHGETVIAHGFGKLVGLVAVAETLYVSDQSAGVVYSAPLAAIPLEASAWTAFAQLPVPDLLCAGPSGTLFSGQFKAAAGSSNVAIRQIQNDGAVSAFVSLPDVAKPSGVAFDATHHRLFAADTGNVAKIGVHIFPVP
ncbi:MAG: SMP-30/gluconolactonase/LRE family protein [Pseudomonadota bacterium]